MHFLTPWNLPGDGLAVLGAGTCWAFVALPPLWVLMEKPSHWQQKQVVSGIVETLRGFEIHIISGYKKEWRC